MRSKRIKKKLVMEYIAGGRSYRELEAVYGIAASTLQRWVAASGLEGKADDTAAEPVGPGAIKRGRKTLGISKRRLPVGGIDGPKVGGTAGEEIKRLRKELEEERLRSRLLEAMIEIAEEEFEIPIRKKSGARR